MFTAIRRIHLYAGVVLLVFVGMYFVTGFIMINDTWFPRAKPVQGPIVKKTIAAKPQDLSTADPQAAGEFVKRSLGLTGANRPAKPPTQAGKPWQFNYIRPGTTVQVTVPTTQPYSEVEITMRQSTAATTWDTANAFHHFRGYGFGWQYDAWAVFYDAAAVAMILFALTGIYLWWKLSKLHWPGLVILAATTAFTVATWWYLIAMP
jgi:hypothetical protein